MNEINKLKDIVNGLNRFERDIKSIRKTKVFVSFLDDAKELLESLGREFEK